MWFPFPREADAVATTVAGMPLRWGELAIGVPLRYADEEPPGWDAIPGTPREVLETLLAELLQRHHPVLVTFSGGRDSSTLLAVALRVARREGLPEPVAVTLRFPGEDTNETEWQQAAARAIGVKEWEILHPGDELQFLGPVHTEALRRHGMIYPSNTHFSTPMFRAAAGGCLVTGAGGDEVLSVPMTAWAHLRSWRYGDARWEWVLARRLALALAPVPVRQAVEAWRSPLEGQDWLTPGARRKLRFDLTADGVRRPLDLPWALRWWQRSHYYRMGEACRALLAADEGTAVASPFLHSAFVSSVARHWGRLGITARSGAVHHLAGDELPEALRRRTSKASFDSVFWGPAAEAFGREASLGWVPARVIDRDALRREWLGSHHAGSSHLLSAAWVREAAGVPLGSLGDDESAGASPTLINTDDRGARDAEREASVDHPRDRGPG